MRLIDTDALLKTLQNDDNISSDVLEKIKLAIDEQTVHTETNSDIYLWCKKELADALEHCGIEVTEENFEALGMMCDGLSNDLSVRREQLYAKVRELFPEKFN